MRKQILLICINFFFSSLVFGQINTIAQFAIWKPKEGKAQSFEEGYKHHLLWHKSNNDTWNWHGWYIISGPRYGQFVDATFDHTWSDFDNAIKPFEDIADNRLHVFPFGEVQSVFKVCFQPNNSIPDTLNNKLKLVSLVTINVINIHTGLNIVDKVKEYYASKKIQSFKTYKMIDGGLMNQIILMLGFSDWEDYSIIQDLYETIYRSEQLLKTQTILSINSETMIYRDDLSLIVK